MEVLLGGISSLLYGVADFLGGEGARKVSAATVVLWAGTFSLPVLAVVAIFVGGIADQSDYLFGSLAGFSGAVGLTMLFAGLARGRAAVIAPVSAALAAMMPVAAGVIAGERPPLIAWAGVLIAIPAIALSAWGDDTGGSTRAGLVYGAVAGVGFGGFAVLIGFTSDESGLLALIPARGAMILLILFFSLMGVWRVEKLSKSPVGLIASNSVLDLSANVTLLLALRAGSFALAAVAASFYPAVTVLLARVVNGEGLHRRQIAGIFLTLVALSLISIG